MAYLFVLLAAILWGTTGTAQSFIQGQAHPLTIGAARLAIGGLSLFALAVFMKKMKISTFAWRAAMLASLSMALFQPLFFSAVQLTGIAVGTVVTIGSAPVLSGFIEWLTRKERPDRIWAFATFLAITGCILLFAESGSVTVNPLGILSGLGGGAAFAAYTSASKKVLEEAEPFSAVAVIFSLAAVLLLPFLLIFDISYAALPVNLAVLVYLGLGTTKIAYLLFSTGLKAIPSSSAVTLSLAEPLTAALLGVFLVGETLSTPAWVGVALLLGGILAITARQRKS